MFLKKDFHIFLRQRIKFIMSNSTYCTKIRTRYSETDQMGYIHHSVYPVYLELARIEWLNKLGVSYKQLEINGILLPVYTMSIKYLVPLTFDELIEVKVKLKELKGPKLIFSYEIFNEKGQKSTEAEVILFFAAKNGKPIKPPADVVEKLPLS